MSGRYRASPQSITEIVDELERQITALEQNPRVGNTSIDNGDLVLKGGKIVVASSGNLKVIQIYIDPLFASLPVVYLAPKGDLGEKIGSFRTFDNGSETLAQISILPSVTHTVDGGQYTVSDSQFVSDYVHSGFGAERVYIQMIPNGSSGDSTYVFHGAWYEGQITNEDALYVGASAVPNGFSSFTVSYAAIFSSTILPFIGIHDVPASLVDWCLTSYSTSGFTVEWIGTDAKTIMWWNTRV